MIPLLSLFLFCYNVTCIHVYIVGLSDGEGERLWRLWSYVTKIQHDDRGDAPGSLY